MQTPIKSALLVFSSLVLLWAASCGKTDDTPAPGSTGDYYFRAKLNGKQLDFLHSAQFQGGGNDNRWEHIIFSGYESKYDASKPLEEWPHNFNVDMWNEGGDFPSGTYTEAGGGPHDDEAPNSYDVDGEYHIQTKDHGTLQYDARETNDFTLTITEISAGKGIKGTFKGTLSNENDFSDKITVTDGEFYLPPDAIVNP